MHPAVWPQYKWAENWGAVYLVFGEGSSVPIQHDVAWTKANLRAKCHLDLSSRLVTIDMGRKLGRGSAPFLGGELGPHVTRSPLGRGLPPYQVAS